LCVEPGRPASWFASGPVLLLSSGGDRLGSKAFSPFSALSTARTLSCFFSEAKNPPLPLPLFVSGQMWSRALPLLLVFRSLFFSILRLSGCYPDSSFFALSLFGWMRSSFSSLVFCYGYYSSAAHGIFFFLSRSAAKQCSDVFFDFLWSSIGSVREFAFFSNFPAQRGRPPLLEHYLELSFFFFPCAMTLSELRPPPLLFFFFPPLFFSPSRRTL